MKWNKRFLVLTLCTCLVLSMTAHGAETVYVTRGTFITALYETYQSMETILDGDAVTLPGLPRAAAAFQDVTEDDPYYAAVNWASSNGIAGGYAGGWFQPNVILTREQAAVILQRYEAFMGWSSGEEPTEEVLANYQDSAAVSVWCRPAVAWAVEEGHWFSGSPVQLKSKGCVTEEESKALGLSVHQGGMKMAIWNTVNDSPTVTATLIASSAMDATVRLENTGSEVAYYGADFALYHKVNGGWYSWFTDGLFIMIAYDLAPGETRTWEADWVKTLGVLPDGEYRLTKAVTAEGEPHTLAVDFTIAH